MPLHALFQAFADTSLSHAMRDSTWGFAIIETFHLVGLAVLGGALLAQNLNVAGVGATRFSPAETTRSLKPVILASVTVMAASGVLLVASNPMKYYFNDAFRVKILLFALALASSAGVAALARRETSARLPTQLAAGLGLLLWLGVALGGRLIGLL